jgi:SAM-dependent methyltransferase
MSNDPDFSESFYRSHAQRYAEVSHNFIQSVYSDVSHPGLNGDTDLMDRLQELVPPECRGLDAGCGAGARDVFFYWQKGYDIYGVDAVDENIVEARRLHPEIASRVSVVDLREPLGYPDASFDFVLCNAVIQHIEPAIALGTTLPEFARVLRAGGVLQLMFKYGSGVATVYDRDYGADRTFQLYDVDVVLGILENQGLRVIPQDGEKLGGVMYFKDPKPMDHCVFFARKET